MTGSGGAAASIPPSQPAATQPPTPFQGPQNLPFTSIGHLFKGRDLESLHAGLTQDAAAAITGKAVHGLGGVGKTRLAVEYGWRYASEYSALLWAVVESRTESSDASAPLSLDANLARLGAPETLNLSGYKDQTEPEQKAAVLKWLATHPGWLLILDNADSSRAVQAVLELLPRLKGGRVLITSRYQTWGASVQGIELGQLPLGAAIDFLLERTASARQATTDTDRQDAEDLANELGCLALALEQAGAYIVARGKTIAEYLALWRSHEPKVQAWYKDHAVTAYPVSVAVTYETTLAQLSEGARDLLNVLAWMAPEPLPQSVLELQLDEGQTFDPEPHLEELKAFSLITWRDGTVSVHRVLQEVLRAQQESPYPALTIALSRLKGSKPEGKPDDYRSWSTWETLRPHIEAACEEGERLSAGGPISELLGDLGFAYWGRALHGDAERVERRALALDETRYGNSSPEYATRAGNLAVTLRSTNRLQEAEPLMRRALKIDEAAYGEHHPNVAIRLNNLAQLLQATSRLEEAEPLMRRALKITQTSYGEEHPLVAIQFTNLAGLLKKTNRLEEAEPLMRRALEIDEAVYGERHPEVAGDLNNLASLLHATNRLEEAEPLMRRALEIDESSYGERHPKVATSLNNLAQLLQEPNRLEEAEPLMRRALEIDEKAYGERHPNVAIRLNNLARLLQATNRLHEAEPLMRRMVDIFRRFNEATGHENPYWRAALGNYYGLLMEAGLSPNDARERVGRVAAGEPVDAL